MSPVIRSTRTAPPRPRGPAPRATRTGKRHAAERGAGSGGPARLCERCGAHYTRKRWRVAPATAPPPAIRWTVCPACRQLGEREYFGRVRILGRIGPARWTEIARRITNVADRARHTQPMRRVIEIAPVAGGFEVLTTSQKLAHRIGRELGKAFGGVPVFGWSAKDGELLVRWRPRGVRGASARHRRRHP